MERQETAGTVEEDLGAAVEAVMGKIVVELGAALGVLLTSLGTRSGLWAALAGAGPLTTAEVAAKVNVDPALVREWLRAQAAGGYLEYDPATETFTLPDAVAAAIQDGPGGALVDACATMMSSMGEGFGDVQRGVLPRRRVRLAPAHGRALARHGRLHPGRAADRAGRRRDRRARRRGGRAGRRWHASWMSAAGTARRRWASPALYPAADVLGIDYHDASIAHARAEAAGDGVDNVRFEVAAATELPLDELGEGYDLITFFDSLHDIGDPRGALHARPGGGRGDGGGDAVRAARRRRRRGQPQPDGPDVLRRVDLGVHTERGLPDRRRRRRSRWARRPASSGCGRWRPRPGSAGSADSASRRR